MSVYELFIGLLSGALAIVGLLMAFVTCVVAWDEESKLLVLYALGFVLIFAILGAVSLDVFGV